MKRKVLLVLAFMAVGLAGWELQAQRVGLGLRTLMNDVSGAKSGNLFFADRFSFQEFEGEKYVSLLAKVKAGVERGDLEKLSCRVGSCSGNFYTLRVRVEDLERVVESGLFERIDVAKKVGSLHLDKAIQDANADLVQQGLEDLPQGYDGSGVIIGVADWGFDYTHPVFYDSLMQTNRILAVWDQFRTGYTPPEGYYYGALLQGEETYLAAQSDTSNIYEVGYHGTHVAGIAGGSGAGTKYRGIAPGVDFLFSSWLVDEANVLDAYVWMKDFAKSLNRRLVINNSWGVYSFGAMDGTSLMDDFILNLAERDSVILITSAGNNGGSSFHVEMDFNSNDTLRSEFKFNLPTPASEHYWGQTVSMLGDSCSAFSARVELYSNGGELLYQTPWVNTQDNVTETGFTIYNEGDSLIYRVSSLAASENGRPEIEWEVRHSNYYTSARCVLVVASESGYVHSWNVACLTTGVGNWGLPFVWRGEGYVAGNSEYAIGEPGIGKGVITIAAHKGIKRGAASNSQLASFSSGGPNLCDYLKPELSAPGVTVVSALSSFTTEDITGNTPVEFNGRTYEFVSLSGTSMSCPVVSGVAALVLQANPTLSFEQMREILTSTARSDNFTGEVPNFSWGYGKVNALAAVKEAVRLVGLESVIPQSEVKVLPNPTRNTLRVENMPQGCKRIVVCDICGREIMQTEATNAVVDVAELKSGVYFLKLECEGKALSFKFVKY